MKDIVPGGWGAILDQLGPHRGGDIWTNTWGRGARHLKIQMKNFADNGKD